MTISMSSPMDYPLQTYGTNSQQEEIPLDNRTPLLQNRMRMRVSSISERVSAIYNVRFPEGCCMGISAPECCSQCCEGKDTQKYVSEVALSCLASALFTAVCGTGLGALTLVCDHTNPGMTFAISYAITGILAAGSMACRGCCWVIRRGCA